MDFFRVELLRYGSVVGYVSKEDGYQLPFTLDGTPGGKDFFSKELWCVGLRFGVVDWRDFF